MIKKLKKPFLLILFLLFSILTLPSCKEKEGLVYLPLEEVAVKEAQTRMLGIKDISIDEGKNLIEATEYEVLINKIKNYSKKSEFSGSFLLAINNKIVYANGLGYSDSKKEVFNTMNSIYKTGDFATQVTSAIILKLSEQGKINLDLGVDKYLLELNNFSDIKVIDLLTLSSGLFDYVYETDELIEESYSYEMFINNLEEKGYKYLIGLLNKKGINEEYPTEVINYTDYYLLSNIIEKVTNKTYKENVEELFKTLNMTNSTFEDNMITSFSIDKEESNKLDNNEYFKGWSNIKSNVLDIYKWNVAFYTNEIVSKEMLDMIYLSDTKENKNYYNYGVSFGYPTESTISSYYINEGYSYINVYNREIGVNLIVLSNDTNEEVFNAFFDKLWYITLSYIATH